MIAKAQTLSAAQLCGVDARTALGNRAELMQAVRHSKRAVAQAAAICAIAIDNEQSLISPTMQLATRRLQKRLVPLDDLTNGSCGDGLTDFYRVSHITGGDPCVGFVNLSTEVGYGNGGLPVASGDSDVCCYLHRRTPQPNSKACVYDQRLWPPGALKKLQMGASADEGLSASIRDIAARVGDRYLNPNGLTPALIRRRAGADMKKTDFNSLVAIGVIPEGSGLVSAQIAFNCAAATLLRSVEFLVQVPGQVNPHPLIEPLRTLYGAYTEQAS